MSSMLTERRRRERVTLHCPVEVHYSAEAGTRQGMTRNVSSNGVYFISGAPFSAGERLFCEIEITPRSCSLGIDAVYLESVLEVVRVERMDDGYGVGCRLVKYVLRRKSSREAQGRAVAAGGARMEM